MMVLFALMGFGDVLIGGVVVPQGNTTSCTRNSFDGHMIGEKTMAGKMGATSDDAGNMGDTSDDDVREGGGMLTDKNETEWWSHDDSSKITTSCCWFGPSLITEKEADDAGSCCWFEPSLINDNMSSSSIRLV